MNIREEANFASASFGSDFGGTVAIVTGAGQGIGEAVAKALAALGAHVFAADIRGDAVQALAAEAATDGGLVTAAVVDVTNSADVDGLVAAARKVTGAVDILINAAGGFRAPGATEEVTDEEWDQGLDLNLGGAFRCCRAVIPAMRASRRGRIVNISSEAGRMPLTQTVAYYAAAKAGVIGLTRHLARELGPVNITVNAVAPGTTLTPRVRTLHSADLTDRILSLTPLGRLAETSDQVGPILFLASRAADYITGATLDVNGGRLML